MLIDFGALRPRGTPNEFLMLPEGYGPLRPQAHSPRFAASAESLRDAWLEILKVEPRTEVTDRSPDGLQIEAVQRTAVFRFPDLISARFVPLPDGGSTLAVYSRARFGRWDFGVNRRRIERWLARLRQQVPVAQS